MIANLLRAVRAVAVLAVITGVAYPLAVTGIAQLAFPDQAGGSLVRVGDTVVGSHLVGQQWQGQGWFYGRPSAVGYDGGDSGGTNLGPSSEELAAQIRHRAAAIVVREGPYVPGLTVEQIPVDLVLASGSGLDPHISPAAARLQAPRVAATRGLPVASVEELIVARTSLPPLGLFGAAGVSVLELNVALEQLG